MSSRLGTSLPSKIALETVGPPQLLGSVRSCHWCCHCGCGVGGALRAPRRASSQVQVTSHWTHPLRPSLLSDPVCWSPGGSSGQGRAAACAPSRSMGIPARCVQGRWRDLTGCITVRTLSPDACCSHYRFSLSEQAVFNKMVPHCRTNTKLHHRRVR